jgi:hypothetical protein
MLLAIGLAFERSMGVRGADEQPLAKLVEDLRCVGSSKLSDEPRLHLRDLLPRFGAVDPQIGNRGAIDIHDQQPGEHCHQSGEASPIRDLAPTRSVTPERHQHARWRFACQGKPTSTSSDLSDRLGSQRQFIGDYQARAPTDIGPRYVDSSWTSYRTQQERGF